MMLFLKTALKDFNVGAISGSSQFVVRGILRKMNNASQLIIEHGAGTGIMTKALLSKVSPHGKLIAIESNIHFVKELEKINDPRLIIFFGTVQEFYTNQQILLNTADYIVSSIPFSFLLPKERELVVKKSYDTLAKNGSFIIFHQYSWLMKKNMHQYFNRVSVRIEPLNIFPCFILNAKK